MIGLLIVTIWNTLTTTENILAGGGLPIGAFDPESILILDPGVGPGILVVADRADWIRIPLWLELARRTWLHIWREQ